MDKIKVVSIVGPTASGKTSLSVAVARKFRGEIISADSMQIYKKMDIGTAKPSREETKGIPHHLMDFLDVDREFSVAQYVEKARTVIREINSRNNLPILVGGTGLYVDSLLNNVQFTDTPVDYELRKSLMEEDNDTLLSKLYEVDRISYEKLSKEINRKRIVRALEIYYQTGKPKSVVDKEALSLESPYKTIKIGLKAFNRDYLYNRINRRVDIMVETGLLEEAKEILSSTTSSTASKAIGYKEFIPYFQNKSTLDECIETLKMNTRRYAKRQLTWFKRDKEINWFDIDTVEPEELENRVFEIIERG